MKAFPRREVKLAEQPPECCQCGRDVAEVNALFHATTPEGAVCLDCFMKVPREDYPMHEDAIPPALWQRPLL